MSYIDKYAKIRPFVKLNIPHNKKMFTTAEKSAITKYYNRLIPLGYLDREKEGYILKNISNTGYKIKGIPKIKAIYVNVGTRIVEGKIETDKRTKIKIVNGTINIQRQGMPYSWEFTYNINRDWTLKEFLAHLRARIKPNKLHKGNLLVIGAGMYEMRGSADDTLSEVAKEILRLSNKYNSMIESGERSLTQSPEYFMYRIVVYKNRSAFKIRLQDKKKRKKKLRKGKRL